MRAQPSRAELALILAAGLGAGAAAAAKPAPKEEPAASQPANAVRPEFGKPFNEAQELLKADNGAGALAKLKEAEAVGNLLPYEAYVVLRLRGAAEYQTGDLTSAAKDYETVMGSDQLPATDRLLVMKALSEWLYTDKQYAKAGVWMQRYIDAGGDDPQLRDLLPQTYYIEKNYPAAVKALTAQVDGDIAAGRKPTEKSLKMLAYSQAQIPDDAGYEKTVEKLAVSYPTPDYWKNLMSIELQNDKFSDRLYVDVYRLKTTVFGQVTDRERLSYSSLALRGGFPAESKRVIDEAIAKNTLTGADAADAKKLSDSASRGAAQDRAQAAANEAAAKSAKDGNALTTLGLLVTMDGNPAHGVDLLQQGIAKGGLKYPDEAHLHLGVAQYKAGNSAEALKTFQAITTPAGTAILAHVWALWIQSQSQGATASAAPASAAVAK